MGTMNTHWCQLTYKDWLVFNGLRSEKEVAHEHGNECGTCGGTGVHVCDECDDEHSCGTCGGEGFVDPKKTINAEPPPFWDDYCREKDADARRMREYLKLKGVRG